MKLDASERDILRSVEKGEWKSVSNVQEEKKRYSRIARETLRKNRRVNIRISENDLEALRIRAFEEGLPYQTLIASLLHKYATGRLREA